MRLVFSEAAPDYARYLYPFVVWAFPEPGETPADFYEAGFLPSPDLSRYYLGRQLRVPLSGWTPTSENRRVLGKGADLVCELLPRGQYPFTEARRAEWLAFAEARFGPGVMPVARLDRLMSSPVVTHVLRLLGPDGIESGAALLYLEHPRVGHYQYAFYDLSRRDRNAGMHMMTRAVRHLAEEGYAHIHLGTCYSEAALYKAAFEPLEFFNGHRWSRDAAELRHLVRTSPATHRLEDADYLARIGGDPRAAAAASGFRLSPAAPRGGTPGSGR
jgi:hypothetical protein